MSYGGSISIIRPHDKVKAVPTLDMIEEQLEEDQASDESDDETEQPRLVQIATQLRKVSIKEVSGVNYVFSVK